MFSRYNTETWIAPPFFIRQLAFHNQQFYMQTHRCSRHLAAFAKPRENNRWVTYIRPSCSIWSRLPMILVDISDGEYLRGSSFGVLWPMSYVTHLKTDPQSRRAVTALCRRSACAVNSAFVRQDQSTAYEKAVVYGTIWAQVSMKPSSTLSTVCSRAPPVCRRLVCRDRRAGVRRLHRPRPSTSSRRRRRTTPAAESLAAAFSFSCPTQAYLTCHSRRIYDRRCSNNANSYLSCTCQVCQICHLLRWMRT